MRLGSIKIRVLSDNCRDKFKKKQLINLLALMPINIILI